MKEGETRGHFRYVCVEVGIEEVRCFGERRGCSETEALLGQGEKD